jgi:hypothetical protein
MWRKSERRFFLDLRESSPLFLCCCCCRGGGDLISLGWINRGCYSLCGMRDFDLWGGKVIVGVWRRRTRGITAYVVVGGIAVDGEVVVVGGGGCVGKYVFEGKDGLAREKIGE